MSLGGYQSPRSSGSNDLQIVVNRWMYVYRMVASRDWGCRSPPESVIVVATCSGMYRPKVLLMNSCSRRLSIIRLNPFARVSISPSLMTGVLTFGFPLAEIFYGPQQTFDRPGEIELN